MCVTLYYTPETNRMYPSLLSLECKLMRTDIYLSSLYTDAGINLDSSHFLSLSIQFISMSMDFVLKSLEQSSCRLKAATTPAPCKAIHLCKPQFAQLQNGGNVGLFILRLLGLDRILYEKCLV